MGYFDVFISFLDKDSIPYTFSMEGQKTLRLNLKYLEFILKINLLTPNF